jgi:hypothetical protein
MLILFAAVSTLSAALALIDVPELEPYDDDEVTETFDRLQGYPPRHYAEQRHKQKPNPLGLVGALIKRLPKRNTSHPSREDTHE